MSHAGTLGDADLLAFWIMGFLWRLTSWATTPILVLADMSTGKYNANVIFRQDYKKAIAKLSILMTLMSLLGTAFSWSFLRSGVVDPTELIGHEVSAMAIGGAVGLISAVIVPLLIWKWPWAWLLVINMVIITAILTASWGQWGSVAWQVGLLVAFNIGAGIAYMKARRYAMTIYICTAISLSVYISGKLTFSINTPAYRRLDVLWCSSPANCAIDVGGALSVTLLLLCINAAAQHVIHQTVKQKKRERRDQRYEDIAREQAETVQEEYRRNQRARREHRAEIKATDRQRKKQVAIDAASVTTATTSNGHHRSETVSQMQRYNHLEIETETVSSESGSEGSESSTGDDGDDGVMYYD